jgi:hypothetical protein
MEYIDLDFERMDLFRPVYLKYNDPIREQKRRIYLETDWIRLVGGKNYLISHGSKTMTIPLDPNQLSCIQLKNFSEDLTTFFSSKETRRKIFGGESDNYHYLRTDPNTTCMYFHHKNYKIATEFLEMDDNKKNPMNLKDILAISKEITYQTEIKLVFVLKLWVRYSESVNRSETSIPINTYGINFEATSIQYKKDNYASNSSKRPAPFEPLDESPNKHAKLASPNSETESEMKFWRKYGQMFFQKY